MGGTLTDKENGKFDAVGRVKTAAMLTDTDGALFGFKMVDGKPRISIMPYLFDISEGNLAGHVPWTKIGYNPDVSTVEEDIWSGGGKYKFCQIGGMWKVFSASSSDTGVIIHSGTSVAGSLTTLENIGENFLTTTAIGDCVILDKSGSSPEWGYITAINSDNKITIGNGFSSLGSGSGRSYRIVDQSAHTGAQAVKIEYLKSDYTEASEICIMDGTGVVNTVGQDFFRVNSFRVVAAGIDTNQLSIAAGNLTLQADGTGPIYSFITAGFTRARNSAYTVPLGKTLYVTQFTGAYGTAGNANKENARIYTRANIEPATKFRTGNLFYPFTEFAVQNSTVVITYECPTKLPAKTDIKISAIATSSGQISTVLRGWLE